MNQLTRRTFLSRSARGAALGALSPVLAARRAWSANDRLGMAVIGLRGIGFSHLKRILAGPDTDCLAVCDVDREFRERAVETVKQATGRKPKAVVDFRHLLDDPAIDAVVIATPHHWHAPIAVRALRAGKDLYVEKPASHVFREGRVILDTARKHGRIVQQGTQMRSSPVTLKAGELLKAGVIGEVKMSKAWNLQRHRHRTPVPDGPVPPGVDYDLWLGPAPKRPFNANRFHNYWQWHRDYGNGDIGNDGSHDLDMARFGLNPRGLPIRITAHGSCIDLKGLREYPDNMMVAFQYPDDKVLLYEDRGWTPYGRYGFDSGNAFYGTEGFMVFSRRGYFQVYLGKKEEKGPGMRGGIGKEEHFANFLDCVRSRKQPNASAEEAHLSCALSHLGDIAYLTQRVLHLDPKTETILNDPEANAMLTKEYREPWSV
ncbi:MAG: Gfo/Idh/MocA family oxidoreductase [Acidobacteria bacterium]|nr:Gfo/Idh/MocA family oxidoreductase [Acidobacteriota bacterium]